MNPSEIESLHGYAKDFLNAVERPITPDVFRAYVRNLEEDIATLSDTDAATRIRAALVALRGCDYVLRRDPEMKNNVVLPAVEKLVRAIGNEIRPGKPDTAI